MEDGFKYVKELKVVGQDSLGRDIKERVKVKKKKYKKVFATVHELQREKNAILHSTLTYIDMVDGAVLTIEPFRVCATFSDVGYDARGDHRALSGNHSGGSRSVDRFPSDYEMAMQASESMKHRVKKHLKTFVF